MENWLKNKTKELLIPAISDFIKIPNQSRLFDKNWETNGLQDKACQFSMDFAEKLNIKGYKCEYLKEEGKTSTILAIIDPFEGSEKSGDLSKTILMYGHIDKQPPLNGLWDEGLGPWTPVIKDGKLYGRGGADDGYAFFSCVLIIKALQEHNLSHNRIVLFFETDEESGSRDLVFYLNKYKDKIKEPSLIFCLDSGTTDYEHLCLTTTLRGLCCFNLRVDVMSQGVHSGDGSGVIPSPYRILRHVLNQFEDSETGLLIDELYVDIPKDKYNQAFDLIKYKGGYLDYKFPMFEGVEKVSSSGFQNYLNRIWRPQLSVTGSDGTPPSKIAGNVSLPWSQITCSVRLPPSLNSNDAAKYVKDFFEKIKVPYNAKLSVDVYKNGTGFECPPYSSKFENVVRKSAKESFGKPVLFYGEGGSIPFLNDIKNSFPKAQFIVTGVLGPESNAHGPNEMLELNYLEKLVIAMAKILKESPNSL